MRYPDIKEKDILAWSDKHPTIALMVAETAKECDLIAIDPDRRCKTHALWQFERELQPDIAGHDVLQNFVTQLHIAIVTCQFATKDID